MMASRFFLRDKFLLTLLRSTGLRIGEALCEKPCGTAVSVDKRVDPYCLGIGRNTQFVRRPVAGVLPSIKDRAQRIAEVDSNLLVCNPLVDVMRPPFARPCPNVSVQAGVQVFEEVVGQQFTGLQRCL